MVNFITSNILPSIIADVTIDKKDSRLELAGTIDRIVQTGGPTIFHLSDGTGSLALKGFEAPGARAHPHINEGDAVTAVVTVQEYNHELEGEIVSIKKLTGEEKEALVKNVEITLKNRAKIEPPEFLVKNKTLDIFLVVSLSLLFGFTFQDTEAAKWGQRHYTALMKQASFGKFMIF